MRRSSSTKDRIFEQACLLFAEHGYEGVSVRQIAEAVNVRHRTVQYHYLDKEELYTRVFHKLYDLDNVLTYDMLLNGSRRSWTRRRGKPMRSSGSFSVFFIDTPLFPKNGNAS